MNSSLRAFRSRLKVTGSFIRLYRDPTKLNVVFEILDTIIDPNSGLAKPERAKQILQMIADRPGNEGLFVERPIAPRQVDLDALVRLPEATLGFAYGTHMKKNNLDPNFFTPVEPVDQVRWLALRLRQVHDVWHVLTNFGVNVIGEIGLQAFTAAQIPGLFSPLIVAGGILRSIGRGELPITNEAVADGFFLGRSARGILHARFEEMWERPLDEVRGYYHITPIDSSAPYALVS